MHKQFEKYRVFNDTWSLDNKNGSTEFFSRDILGTGNLLLEYKEARDAPSP